MKGDIKMRKRKKPIGKAGKSGGLHSPQKGLKESKKHRHYSDTTHNYGNFFDFK